MRTESWPQHLVPVGGPFAAARISGAMAGMGNHGPHTVSLIQNGFIPPDLLCGMTLFLLARQPRAEPQDDTEAQPSKASAIAGGVWVRERFTIHRPITTTDAFVVAGSSTGRYVRKGRRYGTTTSQSVDSTGELATTNVTTGLLSYRAVEGLGDQVEGLPVEETPAPEPDRSAAAAIPALDGIRGAIEGERLGGEEMTLSLAMMAARDTENPDNPIHSDLDSAREAGLERPIAGGSHVLAFALEPILARFGSGTLFHGAYFDIRWKAPTEADATIIPTATISSVADGGVVFDLDVTLDGSVTAMTGSVVVPLP